MSKKSSTSYTKALLLLGLLVFLFIIASNVKEHGLPSQFQLLLSTSPGTKETSLLDSTKQVQVKNALEGFWVFDSTYNPNLKKTDLVEYKTNGYVWQVTMWSIKTSQTDSFKISRILNAYTNPYAKHSHDSLSFTCETRIIRQAYIYNEDTCYGQSNLDEIWTLGRVTENFNLNGRIFKKYTGEITKFFPDSMIDLVDKLSLNACDIQRDPRIESMNLLSKLSNTLKDSASISTFLNQFYYPLCVEEITREQYGNSEKIPNSLAVQFEIKDGNLHDIKILSDPLKKEFLTKAIIKNIAHLRFESIIRDKFKMSHTFIIPISNQFLKAEQL